MLWMGSQRDASDPGVDPPGSVSRGQDLARVQQVRLSVLRLSPSLSSRVWTNHGRHSTTALSWPLSPPSPDVCGAKARTNSASISAADASSTLSHGSVSLRLQISLRH